LSARHSTLRWVAPAITVVLLAGWELGARAGLVPQLYFPAPSTTFAKLLELAESGELANHASVTLARMLVAFLWGGGAGLFLGTLLGYSPRLRLVVDPFIAVLHPIPRMALLPLILLIFGLGFFSKALAVAVAAFFPMVINTMTGVLQIDRNYYDVARLHGASRWRIFWRVVIPASLPTTLAGARLALNRALGATIGLELITAHEGLGSMLFFAWQTYRTEELYATIFVIGVFGYGFRRVVQSLGERLVPWNEEAGGR
jgi:ABC-type nitrate/sulfonate/bicarbonate transport system permease component